MTTTTQQITATRTTLANGKHRIEVREGGQVVDTRTTTHDYRYVLVQRWAPVGAEGEYGEAGKWAPRYSAKPKKVGARMEYGYIAQVVAIQAEVA